MQRVLIHSISCTWSTGERPETVLLRISGAGQSPKTFFLGHFSRSENRRFSRLSHVATSAVTLSLSTSAQGPLIGVYSLPPARSCGGDFDRHLVSFISRTSGAVYRLLVSVAHVVWTYTFSVLRVMASAIPIPTDIYAEVEVGLCAHDRTPQPPRKILLGKFGPGDSRSVGDGLDVSFTCFSSTSVTLYEGRLRGKLLGTFSLYPLDEIDFGVAAIDLDSMVLPEMDEEWSLEAQSSEAQHSLQSTSQSAVQTDEAEPGSVVEEKLSQGGLVLKVVDKHDTIATSPACQVKHITLKSHGRVIELWIAVGKHRSPTHTNVDKMWSSAASEGNSAEILIDGENVYSRMASLITSAKHSVCLAGWELSLSTPLLLPSDSDDTPSLESLLVSKATDGVRIRLLLWRPVPQLPTILCPVSSQVESFVRKCKRLGVPCTVSYGNSGEPMGPLELPTTVHVILISGPSGILSAHHEKILLIDADCGDHSISMTGGFDVAEGRLDTQEHSFRSGLPMWAKPFLTHPALNWHDLQIELRGPVNRSIYQHFVERWVHAATRDPDLASEAAQTALTAAARRGCKDQHTQWERVSAHSHVSIQFIRSWPFVVNGDSLLNSFVKLFRSAKQYIYIENQYALQAWPLVATLLHQLMENQDLHIIVIAPISVDLPSGYLGSWLDASQDHMYEHLERLQSAAPNRVGVYGLVSGPGNSDSNPSPIYIHSKVIIIDDQTTCIGSANMDNVSLFRSSEIMAICQHHELSCQTRIKLCREHLDIFYRSSMDVSFEETFRAFRSVAEANVTALSSGRILGRVVALAPHEARVSLMKALGNRLVNQSLLSTIVRFPSPSAPIIKQWLVSLVQAAAAKKNRVVAPGSL